ncbi:MAG TPA: CvpA family protein [Spirochaetia bacterium]|nr:CvpA family protein [Spirochaetia bacterium]
MHWVDLVILIIVALSAWKGYRAGLLTSLAGLFAWVLGFLGASHYYYPLSIYLTEKWNLVHVIQNFLDQHLPFVSSPAVRTVSMTVAAPALPLPSSLVMATGVVQAIAFLVILLAVEMVIQSIARSLSSLVAVTPLVVLDRMGGLVFGILWGGVWVLVLTVVATRLAPNADWQGSVILPYLLAVTRTFHVPWPLVM